MINKVNAFIKKNLLLKENATVIVGVSGGPDSMALLHILSSIRDEWNLKLVVVSADHQLRGKESADDLTYAENICREWNIPFYGTSLDVAAHKHNKKVGTQVAARELRYAFFAKQMNAFHADFLALGHHGDDQIETMLMALVRSASPEMLSGIPMKRDFAAGEIIRPLLCATKEEIEEYCFENGIVPRRDPSNEQTTYTRNYFRKELLPLLKEKNSNLHSTVQHLSHTLQEDEQFLTDEAKKMVNCVVDFHDKKEEVSFKIDLFKTYPHSLQRRAFHLILNYLYKELPKNLSYVHEEQFFTMLKNGHGNVQIDFPQNLKLIRTYHNVVFCFSSNQSQHYSYHKIMDIPGDMKLPNGITISAVYTDSPDEAGSSAYICNKNSVALPLHIRTRLAGDRMSWKGLKGSKKVKDIFIDAKVPLNKRDTWPVLTDNNGKILWLIGLKKGLPQTEAKDGTYIQIIYKKGTVQEGKHA
ncbi:tRNA lysidine(34) synthetase TilS [Virgibacillus doumboii]|uniref:tRNA lysidine(34) synthetase TilS n=1 Tax=Virgibacillus doumboii TaxID=2697503 RepID=UPI0013DF2FB4|nr:tRNA lysidine(34) synthetase TilS [Virgibacillus doumboii]